MNTKKNNKITWLGALFSIALIAIIGLTFAFKPSQTVTKKVQPSLYWYKISPSGTIEAQLNSTPQTKDESLPDGSNPLTPCEDQVAGDCIRGYETLQTINEIAPPPVDDNYRVRFSK